MDVKEISVTDMTILPAKKGTCPVCATKHEPEFPHNKDSIFYQMSFYQKNGRWPTWKDAMEHCTEEMKAAWKNELKLNGVEVE